MLQVWPAQNVHLCPAGLASSPPLETGQDPCASDERAMGLSSSILSGLFLCPWGYGNGIGHITCGSGLPDWVIIGEWLCLDGKGGWEKTPNLGLRDMKLHTAQSTYSQCRQPAQRAFRLRMVVSGCLDSGSLQLVARFGSDGTDRLLAGVDKEENKN